MGEGVLLGFGGAILGILALLYVVGSRKLLRQAQAALAEQLRRNGELDAAVKHRDGEIESLRAINQKFQGPIPILLNEGQMAILANLTASIIRQNNQVFMLPNASPDKVN